jgi:hypothetical protein
MNIFGGTKYRHEEEDRLTNAFLSALEKSERDVLSSFLSFLSLNAAYKELQGWILSCTLKQRPLNFSRLRFRTTYLFLPS